MLTNVKPAELLDGLTLDGGWKVIRRIQKSSKDSGGLFSVSYIVENADGQQGFLKALDYSRAFASPDPARVLQALTESYNFERDLLHACRDHHMDKVVIAITDGSIPVGDSTNPSVVQYIIFELAQGNVRSQVREDQTFDLAWSLRALHHIAIGISQLHGKGIAHQDLKPSNVLVFNKLISKLGDLGRAALRGQTPPHERYTIPGDHTYAPVELLYGYINPDWYARRMGADAYLMGSMVVFFFTGVGATVLTQKHLPDQFKWTVWTGSYEEVLPYIRNAFELALEEFGNIVHPDLRIDLIQVVRELCEPNPALRGHPKDRSVSASQYSMERYITKFDVLASRAQLGFVGSRK